MSSAGRLGVCTVLLLRYRCGVSCLGGLTECGVVNNKTCRSTLGLECQLGVLAGQEALYEFVKVFVLVND